MFVVDACEVVPCDFMTGYTVTGYSAVLVLVKVEAFSFPLYSLIRCQLHMHGHQGSTLMIG